MEYAIADPREKFRLASINPRKEDVIEALLARHREDNVLIIGQYLDQLDKHHGAFQCAGDHGQDAAAGA